jgi:Domain of unknown function (DUF4167)
LINNRQGGRRRGRGGQRGQNLGQPGNRQDNRQRGNAAQLLEKYKSLARDSQLAGDRVQTEYYLQFADHYFRVLSETRARFDDQNQRRHRDDDSDDDDEDMVEASEADGTADERDERDERDEGPDRGDRFVRSSRPRRSNGEDRQRGNDRQRGEEAERVNGETIPFEALPPAIGRTDEDTSAAEEPKRPRRRSARARPAESDDEVAPAA